MRWLASLALLVPVHALAQTPIYPNAPTEPTNLNPGVSGSQAPAAPPPPTSQKPSVVIVGPDGKVIGGDSAPAAPGGYFVSGNDPAVQEPTDTYLGPTPELHVVRTGDTLWDVCSFYFNDPWQWPKIWSYNAQITNPHWIYPGDLVRLLPRGVFSSSSGGASATDPDAPQPVKPTDPVPAPARRLEVGTKNLAFVEKADLEKSITIDGSVDEKLLLGNGDQVYLSYPQGKAPQVGKRYSIYEPGRQVKDYGSYVKVLGTLEVLSVKDGKRARAVLLEVTQEVERGAKVGPLVTKFKNVPPVQPKRDVQGPIVAMLTKDQLIGQGELVFVALGKDSGVEVGNRMFVVRRGDAFPSMMSSEVGKDDRRFPARALGEVVIVEVGNKISIGLVTLAVQEMSIGDLVMMQQAK